jgi:hypothetical protein
LHLPEQKENENENIVKRGFRQYIKQCEFRRPGGARRRCNASPATIGIAATAGDAIG